MRVQRIGPARRVRRSGCHAHAKPPGSMPRMPTRTDADGLGLRRRRRRLDCCPCGRRRAPTGHAARGALGRPARTAGQPFRTRPARSCPRRPRTRPRLVDDRAGWHRLRLVKAQTTSAPPAIARWYTSKPAFEAVYAPLEIHNPVGCSPIWPALVLTRRTFSHGRCDLRAWLRWWPAFPETSLSLKLASKASEWLCAGRRMINWRTERALI